MTNCLVNNLTNLTLLIGLPTLCWGLNVVPSARAGGSKKKQRGQRQEHELNRLSLLLSLMAALFFTAAVWALGRKGRLEFSDGLVLVGLFLFWQGFHVFEVLKSNVRQNRSLTWMLPIDLALLGVGAYGVYLSTDWLVAWVSKSQTGFISARHLGWLSGWLMVLPNALLAFYYAWRGNPEVVYTSQVGDGHICIPLCIGIFALFRTMEFPPFSQAALALLMGAAAFHFVMVALFGRLPRPMGWVLVAAYVVFLVKGLGNS
jgi:cation:H+ antiporter